MGPHETPYEFGFFEVRMTLVVYDIVFLQANLDLFTSLPLNSTKVSPSLNVPVP